MLDPAQSGFQGLAPCWASRMALRTGSGALMLRRGLRFEMLPLRRRRHTMNNSRQVDDDQQVHWFTPAAITSEKITTGAAGSRQTLAR